MVINLITTGKWVVGEQLTVPEIVDEVMVCFETLDPRRKYMFIRWLQAHSSPVKNAVTICAGLTSWLGSMPPENMQWEHHLLMDEIGWWCNLDERSLTKIMLADLARSSTP